MASIWGGDSPSVAWNENSWASNVSTITLSGQLATTSVGTPEAFPESGWSSDSWGVENWGESGNDVFLTAPTGLTASLGTLDYAASTDGWSRRTWGNLGWGVDYSVSLTGLGLTCSVGEAGVQFLVPLTAPTGLTSSLGTPDPQIVQSLTAPTGLTSSLGTLTEVGTQAGWGRDDWGQEPWGQSFEPVITLTGLGLTSSIGEVSAFPEQGWGRDAWGDENWGESAFTVVVDVESSGVATSAVGSISLSDMNIGLTGLGSTSSIGSVGLAFGASTEPLSGVNATSSVGSILTEIGVPLTAPSGLTSSVGSILPADVVGISGLGATVSVGEVAIVNIELVNLTGIGATSTVGSISLDQMTIGLTAPSSLTASVGAIAPADVMGLTGQSATVSLGELSPLYTRDLSYNTSASYSAKTYNTSASYTEKNHAG